MVVKPINQSSTHIKTIVWKFIFRFFFLRKYIVSEIIHERTVYGDLYGTIYIVRGPHCLTICLFVCCCFLGEGGTCEESERAKGQSDSNGARSLVYHLNTISILSSASDSPCFFKYWVWKLFVNILAILNILNAKD